MNFATQNPFSEEKIKEYSFESDEQMHSQLKKADFSQRVFSKTPLSGRLKVLEQIKQNLSSRRTELSEAITQEMGKPILEARAEIDKCIVTIDYYIQNGEKFLTPPPIVSHYKSSQMVYAPLGLILLIMPWNFPVWQVVRAMIPQILLGQLVLLKHSDLTQGVARLFTEAVNANQTQSILFNFCISHSQASQLIESPLVKAVSLTGSARAGAEVAAVCGRALKKSVLELGGNDVYIVSDKVSSITEVAKKCVAARMLNAGQSCIAAKRFLVHGRVFEAWLSAFTEELERLNIGDPRLESTQVGPLAGAVHLAKAQEQARGLLASGAKKLYEKKILQPKGFFFAPQVYLLTQDSIYWSEEEMFNPISVVKTFQTDDEALHLANQSQYGLSAAIFSESPEQVERWQKGLEVGMIVINDWLRSQAQFPFGGVKKSGYGRELGVQSVFEFCNLKTVHEGV